LEKHLKETQRKKVSPKFPFYTFNLKKFCA
jgi:hypothetical protein